MPRSSPSRAPRPPAARTTRPARPVRRRRTRRRRQHPLALLARRRPSALVVLLAAIALFAAVGLTSGVADRRAVAGPSLPPVDAALVVRADDGEVLYARDEHRRLRIGSTAKLMTALLAVERLRLDATVVAPAYDGEPGESRMWLVPGESIAVRDLLRGLLLASGNDAAVALAVAVSGSEQAFVALMNARARELGMRDTRYGNPIGLDEGTRSSAADLAALTRELRRHAFVRHTVALRQVALATGAMPRTVRNTNRVLGRLGAVDGVKTGHTEAAGYALVGSATRRGVAVVSVVLGARSERGRDKATVALLRWGLKAARDR